MYSEFNEILAYARLPLVGAFTGYITTDVAIRLLFRPLKPWRILGVRVPLTPGVLPARRGEFADRIGRMVGHHLLTTDDVRSALGKEEFRRELQGAVSERLNSLLETELGTVESLFPDAFQGWVRQTVDQLRQHGLEELFGYLDSPACEREVRQFLQQKGDELLDGTLQSLLPPDQVDALRTQVRKGIGDFLLAEEVGSLLASYIDRQMEEIFLSDAPLRELIPPSLAEAITTRMGEEIVSALEEVLRDPEFTAHLREKLRGSLRSALFSLEGVSGFFARLVDPDRLLTVFPEFPARMEEEITRGLRDDVTRQLIARRVAEGIDRYLDRTPAALLAALPPKKASAVRRLVRKRIVRLARSPEIAELLLSIIERNVERVRERSLRSLLSETLSPEGLHQLREAMADEVIATIRSRAARETVERTLSQKIDEWLFQRPLGQLSALIPARARDELAGMLYVQLAELLVSELPPLVDTLNVQRIVRDKVDSLDILQMEGLLLGIMKESFMFLNLLSALLGFLIGVLNILVPGS